MAAGGRFFFALFSLFRYALNVGLLERPLAIAFFWALITGDYVASLAIGIFFELFWLDLFPAGTFIPPHSVAATITALVLTTAFGARTPATALLPILTGLPMAWAGSRMERMWLGWQNRNYNRLLRRARESSPLKAHRVVWRTIALMAGFWFVFGTIALTLLIWAMDLVMPLWLDLAGKSKLTWASLWLAASIGGILSLRWRRAYGLLAVCAAFVAVTGFIWAGQIDRLPLP